VYWSPDGRLVLTSGSAAKPGVKDSEARQDVRAWEAATGRRLPHLDLVAVPACLRFSADGRTLLTSDPEGICLREVATGQQQLRLRGHLPGG